MIPDFSIPKGSYQLHSDPNFNFQLNRLISWNFGEYEAVKKAAANIYDCASFSKEIARLGQEAQIENRLLEASGYYRMSEFFLFDRNPRKLPRYQLAKQLFYQGVDEYFQNNTVEKITVPFQQWQLPVLHTKPISKSNSGSNTESEAVLAETILLHGGYDSYMEELFFAMLYFAKLGYDTYIFEGPGQGGVLREQHLPFTYKWELPVQAVCDACHLDKITLMGASLGGMLAPRAAAYEKRITHVVAWSLLPNFQDIILDRLSKHRQIVVRFLLQIKARALINAIIKRCIQADSTMKWGVWHGIYALGAASPYEYLTRLSDYKMTDIASLITQDILILAGYKDHFINWHFFKSELKNITAARSLTFQLFSSRDSAEAHCNVGNTALILDSIDQWIRAHPINR